MMNSQGGKIIIVDDLADWRDILQGLLLEAGYTVQVASDSTEAMGILSQEPYHVAIVDLRLDESDENNEEGLILAEKMKDYLPELAIIILTGYAEIPVIKKALQPRENGSSIAFNFLEKHEIPKLLPSIEIAFTHAAKINPQLDIRLASPLSWSMLQNDIACLRSLNPDLARLEIIDLLQRLFHQFQYIDVKATNIGHKDRAMVLVNPTIGNRPQMDLVVKFNQPKQAERESRNYDQYVMHHVGGPKRTQRLDFRATAKLGGIAYSFIGTEEVEFQRFGDLYSIKEVDELKKILNNLFNETCYTWYLKTISPNAHPKSLSACYKEWLGLETSELLVSLREIVQRANVSDLSFIDPRHPDQSDILFEGQFRLTNPLPLAPTPMEYNGPFCFNHGDLHENNILVDGRNQTWLIDFYQTESGHPARDFAMIEAAIKFHLQKSDCSPIALYEWERSLVRIKSLDKKPKLNPSLQNDAEIIKATELILHVRSLLLQTLHQGMGVTDYQIALKDYQIALYFHAFKGHDSFTQIQ